MLPPRNILVAVDHGPASDRAVAHAVALARAFDAKLHVFHALALPPTNAGDFSSRLAVDAGAKIVAEARRWMARMTSRHDDGVLSIRTVLEEGDPRRTILTCAERVEADLVVMGTHGRDGLARWLIGSTTEAIVRTSPVPVLTVHGA